MAETKWLTIAVEFGHDAWPVLFNNTCLLYARKPRFDSCCGWKAIDVLSCVYNWLRPRNRARVSWLYVAVVWNRWILPVLFRVIPVGQFQWSKTSKNTLSEAMKNMQNQLNWDQEALFVGQQNECATKQSIIKPLTFLWHVWGVLCQKQSSYVFVLQTGNDDSCCGLKSIDVHLCV